MQERQARERRAAEERGADLMAQATCPDPEELSVFLGELPGALDSCMHSHPRAAASCHVWGAHLSLDAEDLHDLVIEAAQRCGCDLIFAPPPVTPAVRCACGESCAASEGSCGICGDGVPVALIDGVGACERCVDASKESLGVADTLPPAAPEHEIDAALLGALPGPAEDDAPSFLPAMRGGLGS